METLRQDLRYAIRQLRNRPGFTAVAVLTLALGIGGTVAIFTVLNGVVLEPLPYPESDRLVRLETAVPGMQASDNWGIAKAEYLYFRENNRSFDELALYRLDAAAVGSAGAGRRAERAGVAHVTPNTLDVLGLRPALGRGLLSADNRSGASVALLAHGFWTRHFGADPGIVGRTVRIDGRPVEVVGVLEAGARFPDELAAPGAAGVDLWVPLDPTGPEGPGRFSHSLSAVGRLRPGISVATARADLARLTDRLPEAVGGMYRESFMENTGFSTLIAPLKRAVLAGFGDVLWIVFASVALLLLIACANATNLYLVRTEGRRRELAIRAAMGASRGQLVRQLLTESLVLALAAGTLALLLAFAGVEGLLGLAPAGLPRLTAVGIGWEAVAFTLAVSILAALAVASLPLLRFGAGVSLDALSEGGRGQTAGRERTAGRNLLVVGQVAMALVILAGAALLFQSFRELRAVEPGFDSGGVLTFQAVLPDARYGIAEIRSLEQVAATAETMGAFYRRAAARIEALPGVRSAGAATDLPLAGESGCTSAGLMRAPGDGRAEDMGGCVPVTVVAPGYFRALDIPVRGRAPDWSDFAQGAPVAVVSEAFAEQFGSEEDPIGRMIWVANDRYSYRITAAAGDVRGKGLDEPPIQAVYIPALPYNLSAVGPPPLHMTFVVRADTDEPLELMLQIRRTLAAVDPQVAIANVRSMEQVVAKSIARVSFTTVLLGIGAVLALLLAAVGLYGVIAYAVGRRTNEIGLRMALGARSRQVAARVVRQSLVVALAGVAVGLVAAFAATRVLQSLLFEVSATEPVTLAAVSVVLVGVALVASYLPARRAARVDPMTALRHE